MRGLLLLQGRGNLWDSGEGRGAPCARSRAQPSIRRSPSTAFFSSCLHFATFSLNESLQAGPCGSWQSDCRRFAGDEQRGALRGGFTPRHPVSMVGEQKPNTARLAHPEFILRNYCSANRLESCGLLPANLHTITNDNWEPFRPG